MQWIRRIGCVFGYHQWIAIRYIWVRFHRNMYFKDKYSEEGERVVSRIYCPICGRIQEIQVEL